MQPWSILRPLTCACVLTGLVYVTTVNGAFGDPLAENAISVSSRSYPTAANTNSNAAPIHVEFLVNGKPIRGQGPGQCKHEPNGSIYSAPASLWTVEFSDPKGGQVTHVTLTMWQPKSESPSQMSLVLDTGAGSHRIATVKGGQLIGVGMVSLRTDQSGGRFDIKGKDAAGATIEGSITCPSFGNIVAEGG